MCSVAAPRRKGQGRGEGCGRGEEQSQQLEETCGQQHVATVDQHRHGQHHVGQQPAEECHPGEPGPGEGWYLCLIWGEILPGGAGGGSGTQDTPRSEVGIPACVGASQPSTVVTGTRLSH